MPDSCLIPETDEGIVIVPEGRRRLMTEFFCAKLIRLLEAKCNLNELKVNKLAFFSEFSTYSESYHLQLRVPKAEFYNFCQSEMRMEERKISVLYLIGQLEHIYNSVMEKLPDSSRLKQKLIEENEAYGNAQQ